MSRLTLPAISFPFACCGDPPCPSYMRLLGPPSQGHCRGCAMRAQCARSAQVCSEASFCPLIRFSLDVTELGSDPEQDDVEKRSQSCLQPRVSLQLPKGGQGAWSSSRGGTVIKVEIEPLHPDLVASPSLQEVVSGEGWARGQQGKLRVQKSSTHRCQLQAGLLQCQRGTRRAAGISARMGFFR